MAYANLDGFGWLVEDMQAWTAAQIASAGAHYEPKLRFDSTPVYSVTLAEDVAVDANTKYTISLLPDTYDALLVQVALPSVLDRNGTIAFNFTDSTSVGAPFRGQNGINGVILTFRTGNAITTLGSWGATGSNAWYNLNNEVVLTSAKIEAVSFGGQSQGTTIPAGTVITIYGAQEV